MDPLADGFSLRPDLVAALETIDQAGLGVLLYVMNRNRMRLWPSFERLVMQHNVARESFAVMPNQSSEALRDFGLGAQVLADLGLKKIRLMIHSDRKIAAIEGFGIEVVERIPIPRGQGRSTAAIRREAGS